MNLISLMLIKDVHILHVKMKFTRKQAMHLGYYLLTMRFRMWKKNKRYKLRLHVVWSFKTVFGLYTIVRRASISFSHVVGATSPCHLKKGVALEKRRSVHRLGPYRLVQIAGSHLRDKRKKLACEPA